MRQALARLNNINKTYPNLILNIREFEIFAGQCIIVTGDNGSGKSTLLKIIGGLINADSGVITIPNQTFAAKKNHLLSQQSVYLASKPYLFNYSVEKNIAYPLIIKHKFNYRQQVDQMLSWANLHHLKSRLPTNLSSGETQKVAFARARVLNPQIWLLDEPTENLDQTGKKQICDLLKKLLDEGKSIIIVTHSRQLFNQIPHNNFHLENLQNEH